MQKIEYVYFLTSDMKDRLRVSAQKEKKKILEFMVQCEALIGDIWQPIIRYDTAHGFAHKDIMHPSGMIDKQPLYFDSYNMALTYATLDLKRFWRKYRETYEREMKK